MKLRAAVVALLLASPLVAHEGLHEQIAAMTARIAADPQNASLYVKRGELYRLHQEWPLAARDYDAAQQLDPNIHAIDLGRGTMLFESGNAAAAIASLQRYVANEPRDVHGHAALARALRAANEPNDAATQFAIAIEQSPDFNPDLIVEHAAALVAASRRDDALAMLDRTMLERGPLVSLHLAAIDIDVKAKQFDDALRRVDAAAANAERKETWLARRGDILLAAGRTDAARAAYQSSLAVIAALPPERRSTPALRELEQRLRTAVENPSR